MGLPTEWGGDTYGFWTPSDTTVPSYDQVCRMIRSNEDIIDRRLMRSWRVNHVRDEIRTINTYQHDLNAWRGAYYRRGGNYVQLHRDVLPWVGPSAGRQTGGTHQGQLMEGCDVCPAGRSGSCS